MVKEKRKDGKEVNVLFKLGGIVMTRGICERRKENPGFNEFVQKCLKRHTQGDWGDLDEEDKKENQFSLDKRLRLFSAYKQNNWKVWIITEGDRSYTTILFPSEY